MTDLTRLQTGARARVIQISGDKRYLSRITSIGMNIGSRVEMLQNVKKRPLLVYSRDTMIALNRQEAQNIKVEEER